LTIHLLNLAPDLDPFNFSLEFLPFNIVIHVIVIDIEPFFSLLQKKLLSFQLGLGFPQVIGG
jgi:hypothetical protein